MKIFMLILLSLITSFSPFFQSTSFGLESKDNKGEARGRILISSANKLTIGKTTEREAVAIMGNPDNEANPKTSGKSNTNKIITLWSLYRFKCI